jgi:hypothetical protein
MLVLIKSIILVSQKRLALVLLERMEFCHLSAVTAQS